MVPQWCDGFMCVYKHKIYTCYDGGIWANDMYDITSDHVRDQLYNKIEKIPVAHRKVFETLIQCDNSCNLQKLEISFEIVCHNETEMPMHIALIDYMRTKWGYSEYIPRHDGTSIEDQMRGQSSKKYCFLGCNGSVTNFLIIKHNCFGE